MLKIKDNADILDLMKYGFIYKKGGDWVKKVYLRNENDDKNFYQINDTDRIIQLTRLDGELDDTLYDLIKAGLVEKVKEKI